MIYKPKTIIMSITTFVSIICIAIIITTLVTAVILVRKRSGKKHRPVNEPEPERKPVYKPEDLVHIRNEWVNLLHNAINDGFYLGKNGEKEKEYDCHLCNYAKSFRQSNYKHSSDLIHQLGCERCIFKCTLPNKEIVPCYHYPSMSINDVSNRRIIRSAKHALHIIRHTPLICFDPNYVFQSDNPIPILYVDSINYRRRKKLTYPEKLGIPLCK